MNTTDLAPAVRDALIANTKRDLTDAVDRNDTPSRNTAIGRLRSLDIPVTEIAALADVTTPTVYRISVNWMPDMSEEFDAIALAEEEVARKPKRRPAARYAPTPTDKPVKPIVSRPRAAGVPASEGETTALLRSIHSAKNVHERNRAIVQAADFNVPRAKIAAAAGLKKVGNIIRAARSEK